MKKTTQPRDRVAKSTAGGARSRRKAHKFSVHAPAAHDVLVAGSFNGWTPQALKRNAKGTWSVSLPLPAGTYEYKFVVDSEWLEDPVSPERAPSPLGGFNSVCTIP